MPRKSQRQSRRRPQRRHQRQNRKTGAYKPRNKQRFINRSNPIAENKKVEGTEISRAVGTNLLGNPILTDSSKEPKYLNNEPALEGGTDMAVANLPTGARGYPLADSVFNFNPDSALYQTHGLDNSSMIGSNCYQKMCAAKFLIRWPQPTMNTGKWNGETDDMPEDEDPLAERVAWLTAPENNHMGIIPESPQSYHLYWGFIRTPTGFSDFTTPAKINCSAVQLEQHINLRVEEWFNQRTDRISFIPKTSNTMKIIGKKKLYPPWDRNAGRMPVSGIHDQDDDQPMGTIPDSLYKITWPINKKIHFEPTHDFSGDGRDASGDPLSGSVTYYKNYDWLPFACIVNWNAASLPKNAPPGSPGSSFSPPMVARTVRVPHVLINDITYYRDG